MNIRKIPLNPSLIKGNVAVGGVFILEHKKRSVVGGEKLRSALND